METKLTMGSLFDGIGGFPLAALRKGIEPIWASEIEPFPIKVTKLRFPEMHHIGDITLLNGARIQPVNVVTGGSPCQDLSIAGKRAGLAGERSGLFMEQIRIIKEMHAKYGKDYPRFMVWENVPGAFSSNFGEDFWAVLEETAKIADETITIPEPTKKWDKKANRWRYIWNTVGCIMGGGWSIAWRVVDAQYWRVPQRRRRIYLVADFGGQSAPEVLFKREGLSRYLAESGEARERIAANAERGSYQTVAGFDLNQITCPENRSSIETGRPQPTLCKGGRPSIVEAIPINDKATRHMGGGSSRNQDGSGNGLGVGKPGDPCPTLTAGDKHAVCAGFLSRNSENAHGIGYEEEKSPTLRSGMIPDICSTVSAKWAKGTGGSAGDECQNLVVAVDCRNLYENIEKSATLQSKSGGGTSLNYQNPVRIGYTVRRLTPLEGERLQDYPDGWTNIPGASDAARYKAIGNSVAVCCPEYVLEGIKEVLLRVDLLVEFDFLN